MAKYIKSHSNYVVKKQHQLTNDGVIYERDITTIGGLNKFAKGQKPIYQSGNFIITVRDDQNGTKNYTNDKWFKNNDSEIWTLSNLSSITESTEDTTEIVIKQDYYKLKDFAYYGSCSELIRGSLTDIVDRFPGELYSTKFQGVSITNENGVNSIVGDGLFMIDNPFNINLHTTKVTIDEANEKPLKYFCNNGYKNYEILMDNSDAVEEIIKWETSDLKLDCLKIGEKIGNIYINDFIIEAYKLPYDKIGYFTDIQGIHIRPKKKFYVDFFKSLDAFQRVLLNKDSKPIYSTLFEVTKENEYGYYTELRRFTFPLAEGGYNLSVNTFSYSTYLESLVQVADFYDTVFCDNLYRMMTHEAIKNFDWTYTKDYNSSDAEPYALGGTRIQKMLRLFGREFDEIKYYIDSIAYANNLSYGESSSMPDYFLTDSVENDGWDVTNIYPFMKNENQTFSDDINLTIKPYAYNKDIENICHPYGYFTECGEISGATANDKQIRKAPKSKKLLNKIKQYISDKEYTMNQVNNYFLKMLRLNSRNLYRHKGTIEGIEMILSLFGLKSKRWFDLMQEENNGSFRDRLFGNNCSIYNGNNFDRYDYEIKEYVTFTSGLTDTINEHKGFYELDWYNYTKTIAYNTDNFRNGLYSSYQGLPIRYYYDGEDTTTRYLFPYFDKNKIIDGNPYYQMNGGWMWKTKQYNAKDNVVNRAYTETIKNEVIVDDINALLSIPVGKLVDNSIYMVNDMSKNYISVNGVIYPLLREYYYATDDVTSPPKFYEYFVVECGYNQVVIGNNVYLDALYVSDPRGDKNWNKLHKLSEYIKGREIRIYVTNDNTIICHEDIFQDNPPQLDIIFIRNGVVEGQSNDLNIETKTKFFQLINKDYKYQIGGNGWKQLSINDEAYKNLQNIENYYKGNNPHSGNHKYDDGKEYLSYFTKMFKYAIENRYFDKRCYDRLGINFEEALKLIDTLGFNDIFNYEIEDKKIEFFGDYVSSENASVYTYEMLPTENTDEISYNLSNMNKWKDLSYIEKDGNKVGSTDQIINIKRVDLIFYIDSESSENDAYIKYMDDVVLKYVSQMIPSNTILHIIYEEKETEN